jgi:hypothetical protein
MIAKARIAAQLAVRRGLSENEAAVYIGLSPSKFRELVARGLMPQPRLADSRLLYDIVELDLAFNELPHRAAGSGGDSPQSNSWCDYE